MCVSHLPPLLPFVLLLRIGAEAGMQRKSQLLRCPFLTHHPCSRHHLQVRAPTATLGCCTALHTTAHHCNALHCTAMRCTALHCAAHHCTALHCTPLHCNAQHPTAGNICSRVLLTSALPCKAALPTKIVPSHFSSLSLFLLPLLFPFLLSLFLGTFFSPTAGPFLPCRTGPC